jgi:hypothetical protein
LGVFPVSYFVSISTFMQCPSMSGLKLEVCPCKI